ncbi:MAG: hypothetical protein IPH89_14685 [Bacteroidetes bacterium]|nr:hypothetical protein [Bacteroidota bacterium]
MFATCLGIQESKKEDEVNNPLLGTLFLEQLHLIEEKKVFQNNTSLISNINNVLAIV